jgi:hypothetical protein
VDLGFVKWDYSSIPLLDFHFSLPSSDLPLCTSVPCWLSPAKPTSFVTGAQPD